MRNVRYCNRYVLYVCHSMYLTERFVYDVRKPSAIIDHSFALLVSYTSGDRLHYVWFLLARHVRIVKICQNHRLYVKFYENTRIIVKMYTNRRTIGTAIGSQNTHIWFSSHMSFQRTKDGRNSFQTRVRQRGHALCCIDTIRLIDSYFDSFWFGTLEGYYYVFTQNGFKTKEMDQKRSVKNPLRTYVV